MYKPIKNFITYIDHIYFNHASNIASWIEKKFCVTNAKRDKEREREKAREN